MQQVVIHPKRHSKCMYRIESSYNMLYNNNCNILRYAKIQHVYSSFNYDMVLHYITMISTYIFACV